VHLAPPSLVDLAGSERRVEAEVLVRDGLLRHLVLGVHVAADVPVDAAVRALAVRSLLPRRLARLGAVACYGTALWVLAGGPTPRRLDLAVPPPGVHASTDAMAVHGLMLDPGDLEACGGLGVTGLARTAADELRRLPPAEAWAALDVLESTGRLDLEAVGARLEQQAGHRGVRRARRTLAAWSATRGAVSRSGRL
jgi:hypothetical protein